MQIALQGGSSSPRLEIREFGAPLADGAAFIALLRSVTAASGAGADLAPASTPLASLEAVLAAAVSVGVPRWFTAAGLASGNIRLQLAFVATLFKAVPSMADPSSAAAAPLAGKPSAGSAGAKHSASAAHATALRTALHARLATEDRDGDKQSLGREARTVAQWVNTLDIEGVALHGQTIGQELRDGVGLLKVLDVVEPGLVKWSRVNARPTNRYKMVRTAVCD